MKINRSTYDTPTVNVTIIEAMNTLMTSPGCSGGEAGDGGDWPNIPLFSGFDASDGGAW